MDPYWKAVMEEIAEKQRQKAILEVKKREKIRKLREASFKKGRARIKERIES